MTKVPRRRPAATSAPTQEPWPSYAEPAARVTTTGKVSISPSPLQAMWSEAIGRALAFGTKAHDEAEGLCVAIAILSCSTLEEVREELVRRTHVPVSGPRRRS